MSRFEIHAAIVLWLFAWAIVSLAGAVLGQFRQRCEWRAGFWFMTGLWGVINAGIAWVSHLTGPPALDTLATILLVNCFLDVLYLVVGAYLATRGAALLRGFGWAVLVQGAFLLAFDVYFYTRCLR